MGNHSTLVVANPQSANGALGKRWERLSQQINQHYGEFDHRFTESAGDATRIVREVLRAGEHQLVVAMGGDGTISEVVDGFFDEQGPLNSEVMLGVLPFGTGGDFRRTIGAPKKLEPALQALKSATERRIDVGRLRYTTLDGHSALRHFINIASFGISGLVDQLVNSSSKALGGRFSFAVATARAMRRFRPQRAQLSYDEGPAEEVLLHNIAVANGRFFGGGMMIAPDAELDDGLLDVVTLTPLGWSDLLFRMNRVYKGKHLSLPQVSVRRAVKVEAKPLSAEPILLDVDGETPGKLPALFELLPGALRLKG